ncbi:UreF-domain-containing protein [Tricharina praecox]|uniref:UreF-domain-containing protein n=1 Tax=Tricharina praecox TaxID=43433 RepID=UPI00221F2A82|nr:UreF-domain-containing protein [Tricharina praecox]KAI5854790.1 UreF-domain-containing protein [Tricharina praecox]
MIPHTWLLLSDSALPLGSFAFSSALESYLSHVPKALKPTTSAATTVLLTHFLRLSLLSTSTSILPFVSAAHSAPLTAAELDDILDACTLCTVARRASTSQGRALLTVYDRALAGSVTTEAERGVVEGYKLSVRQGAASGHFGVAWGVVCSVLQLEREEALYVFMFNHAKAVVSAAVRLGLLGPYQAQAVLASGEVRVLVERAVAVGGCIAVEDAGQSVPVLDLYQGRHELLYSRVFNS